MNPIQYQNPMMPAQQMQPNNTGFSSYISNLINQLNVQIKTQQDQLQQTYGRINGVLNDLRASGLPVVINQQTGMVEVAQQQQSNQIAHPQQQQLPTQTNPLERIEQNFTQIAAAMEKLNGRIDALESAPARKQKQSQSKEAPVLSVVETQNTDS